MKEYERRGLFGNIETIPKHCREKEAVDAALQAENNALRLENARYRQWMQSDAIAVIPRDDYARLLAARAENKRLREAMKSVIATLIAIDMKTGPGDIPSCVIELDWALNGKEKENGRETS